MNTYKLEVARTIVRVVDLHIEAESEEEAIAKFESQLSKLACPEIESIDWTDEFIPILNDHYSGEFEVIDAEEV
jgi:hypothetical protein